MVFVSGAEAVLLQGVEACMENKFITLGVDIDVAVLLADGAVAGHELGVFQFGGEELVFDVAAVAVGLVPHLFRGSFGR